MLLLYSRKPFIRVYCVCVLEKIFENVTGSRKMTPSPNFFYQVEFILKFIIAFICLYMFRSVNCDRPDIICVISAVCISLFASVCICLQVVSFKFLLLRYYIILQFHFAIALVIHHYRLMLNVLLS